MLRLLLAILACVPSWACITANGFTYCYPLTIQSGQISGTLTNPTYDLCLGSSVNTNCNTNTKQLATVGNGGDLQNGSGFDVIFTSDLAGSTVLKYCRVLQNTTSGVAQIKVKVPSAAVGTVIYMFTGNAGVSTDQSDCTNAADAFTLACWSFPDGSTLSGAVSCSNLALVNHGSTAVAGQLIGAENGNYMEQGSTTALQIDNTDPLTVSFWFFGGFTGTNQIVISNLDYGAGTLQGWHIMLTGPAINWRPFFEMVHGVAPLNYLSIISSLQGSNTAFHHVTVTYDGSQNTSGVKFYVDAVLDMAPTGAVNMLSASTINGVDTRIGIENNGTLGSASTLDEMVISKTVRSQDWITALYNSQNNNVAFWVLGARQTNTSGNVLRHH